VDAQSSEEANTPEGLMPVVDGALIGTAEAHPRAEVVIRAMETLLHERWLNQVSRGRFLFRWSRLRKALLITEEYQDLRRRVQERSRGKCEVCGQVPMRHIHHEKPVARYPRKALDFHNVQGVCRPCHETIHDHAPISA